MSTCCVVRFIDRGRPLCAFYKHYDGGDFEQTLAKFLADYEMVSGLPMTVTGKIANGMPDLAAQVIANFKDGPGDIYMCATDDEGDYTYEVRDDDETPVVTTVSQP